MISTRVSKHQGRRVGPAPLQEEERHKEAARGKKELDKFKDPAGIHTAGARPF